MTGEETLGAIIALSTIITVSFFTFLPVLIAHHRKTGKVVLVFVLLFIPFIGWFVSLYKACADEGVVQREARIKAEQREKEETDLRHAQLLAAVSNR